MYEVSAVSMFGTGEPFVPRGGNSAVRGISTPGGDRSGVGEVSVLVGLNSAPKGINPTAVVQSTRNACLRTAAIHRALPDHYVDRLHRESRESCHVFILSGRPLVLIIQNEPNSSDL